MAPRRVSASTPISLLALFVALGGAGYAAISSSFPDRDGTFHACANRTSGALRLVAGAKKCRPGEKAVSWAQRGPAGAAGAAGAIGPSGPTGSAGANGSNGSNGSNGTNGTNG